MYRRLCPAATACTTFSCTDSVARLYSFPCLMLDSSLSACSCAQNFVTEFAVSFFPVKKVLSVNAANLPSKFAREALCGRRL
jgi:hypothetical protein